MELKSLFANGLPKELEQLQEGQIYMFPCVEDGLTEKNVLICQYISAVSGKLIKASKSKKKKPAVFAIPTSKQALKETIRTALNEMEHEYETAYIKAALIRSHHLAPHASFSVFLRAISDFTGREYKYDPAQRVDSFIYHNEKEFQTSKSSKWQRGRRIVSYLTDIFDTIQ